MRVQSVPRVLFVAGFIVLLAAPVAAKTIDIGFRSGVAYCAGDNVVGWYAPSDFPSDCLSYQEQGFEFLGQPNAFGFDFDLDGLSMWGYDFYRIILTRLDGRPFSLVFARFGVREWGYPVGLEVASDRGGRLLIEESGDVRFRGAPWHDVEVVHLTAEPVFEYGSVVLKHLTVRVPEPAALLLLGVGALGLAFRPRRR